MSVLTGHVEGRLSHGVLHVHVGHMLHQVMEQLRAAVHRQPVDLRQKAGEESRYDGEAEDGSANVKTLYTARPFKKETRKLGKVSKGEWKCSGLVDVWKGKRFV